MAAFKRRTSHHPKPAAPSGEPPFRKILVANRGEIALRVILACKEMGIQTVAICSEADRDALHVRFADQDICIGPPASAKSYLNIPQVIAAADMIASAGQQVAEGANHQAEALSSTAQNLGDMTRHGTDVADLTRGADGRGSLDVKRGGVFPITQGVKVLALERGLPETSTLARLARLKELQALEPLLADGLREALDLLQTLRMRAQAAAFASGLAPDNLLRPDELGALEREGLRGAFKLVAELQGLLSGVYALHLLA